MRQCKHIDIRVEMNNGDYSHFEIKAENHEDLIGEVCRIVRFTLGEPEVITYADGSKVWINKERKDEVQDDTNGDKTRIGSVESQIPVATDNAEVEAQGAAGAETVSKKRATGRTKKAQPEPQPEPQPEQIVSMKDVVALVSEAAEKHGKEKVKEVLADYNDAKNLADLSEVDLGRFYADIQAMVQR